MLSIQCHVPNLFFSHESIVWKQPLIPVGEYENKKGLHLSTFYTVQNMEHQINIEHVIIVMPMVMGFISKTTATSTKIELNSDTCLTQADQ